MSRLMERNKPCTCKNCHKTFEAVRYNAETCSPACRKAYSRWKQDIARYEREVDSVLDQLRKYRGTDLDSEAAQAVKKIYTKVKSAYDYW